MIKLFRFFGLLLLSLLLTTACTAHPRVVRAVLFYSPLCPHCVEIIQGTIEPTQQQFGAALELRWLDVTTREGRELYLAAVEKYQIPSERNSIPMVLMGERTYIDQEIVEQFPLDVQAALKTGLDWPDLPGLH